MVFSLEILGKCGRGRTTGAARWPANPASFCKIIYRLLEYAISPTPTLLKDTLLKIWLWKILFQKIHFWRKAQSLLEKKHSARSQFVLVQMTCNNTVHCNEGGATARLLGESRFVPRSRFYSPELVLLVHQ